MIFKKRLLNHKAHKDLKATQHNPLYLQLLKTSPTSQKIIEPQSTQRAQRFYFFILKNHVNYVNPV